MATTGNWGDAEDGEIDVAALADGLPPRTVSAPDKEGIRTVVEYARNDEGNLLRTTRKIKTVRRSTKVSKAALARRKWAKFGDCAGLPPGPEPNITYVSVENISLDMSSSKEEKEAKEQEQLMEKLTASGGSVFTCRFCGETGHFTLKCPKRNEAVPKGMSADEVPMRKTDAAAAGDDAAANPTGRYVPPSQRGGARPAGMDDRDSLPTLRVTNLPEDCTEQDLGDLFRTVGATARIYLAKDRQTNLSRGFAFISYHLTEDAQAAIDRIDGHRYSNLILRVEWAKPREDKA